MWTKPLRAASATRWAALVVTAALVCGALTIQFQAVQASPGNPLIAVFITQNHVIGFHWSVGTVLTLTIDDPATLDRIDYQDIEIVEADPDPFVPGSTAARFWPGEAFTIQPGHIVTLSGGGQTRTHTVTSLTVDGADMVGDRLWGTAAPGSIVEVRHHSQRDIVRYETANAAGNWAADFSVPGGEPGESLIHDFNADTRFMVMQNDEDGDHTQIDWQMPRPYFEVRLTQNVVFTWGWPLGYPVTAVFNDPNNGPGADYSLDPVNPIPCDWDPGQGCIWIELGNTFRVRPGHLVALTNSFLTKTHAVSAVWVTGIDYDLDTVCGTAEPGVEVETRLQFDEQFFQRYELAAGGGSWCADFANPGDEDREQATYDVIPWTEGTTHARDEDGDTTQVTWPVNLVAWVGGDHVDGNNWLVGDPVTLEIDDPDTLESPDYTDTAFPTVGPWFLSGIQFDFHGDYDLQIGDVVTLSQGDIVRQHTVTEVAITAIDTLADTASGTATPGAHVMIQFARGDEPDWGVRYTVADTNGYWSVDYSVPGDQLGEDVVDLKPGKHVMAAESDDDGDSTNVSVHIPYPWIVAYLTDNLIIGYDCSLGGDVTLSIDDPETSDEVDYSATQTPAPQYWNPLFGFATFELGDAFTLQPGFGVTMTDGAVTKTHTVAVLQIAGVDMATDQVYGVAAAGSELVVVARSETVRAQRNLVSVQDGSWLAEFSVPGPMPWEQDTIQLETAYIIFAYQSDDDSDRTWVHWVENHPPEIGAIAGPADPVAVNTEVQVSASFNDPDADDTHTAVWDWGDGTTSGGIVAEEDGMVSGSHTYTAAGVYALQLTVCDAASECDLAQYQYLVVYDPAGGFVTGGGWIWSAQGYCHLNAVCEAAEGKASFGFVSKYKRGASVPEGNTEFQFRAGDLNFHSSSYQWLVVNQNYTNAQFKGYGTINGTGRYGFMIWAGDSNPDTFRIKIWVADDETNVVYDNGVAQPIGGGSIVIHK